MDDAGVTLVTVLRVEETARWLEEPPLVGDKVELDQLPAQVPRMRLPGAVRVVRLTQSDVCGDTEIAPTLHAITQRDCAVAGEGVSRREEVSRRLT